jgi:hypothetical protein
MSHAEAESRTGSKVLADAITKEIFSLPPSWGLILHNKILEPFCTGDWFIYSNEPTPDSPFQIFRTTFVSEDHLVGESFRFSLLKHKPVDKKNNICQNPSNLSMHKSKCISFTRKFFYCGNYLTSKLLLSRISWQCNDIQIFLSLIFQLAQFTKHPFLIRTKQSLLFRAGSAF